MRCPPDNKNHAYVGAGPQQARDMPNSPPRTPDPGGRRMAQIAWANVTGRCQNRTVEHGLEKDPVDTPAMGRQALAALSGQVVALFPT
jgi:hypothetical protein